MSLDQSIARWSTGIANGTLSSSKLSSSRQCCKCSRCGTSGGGSTSADTTGSVTGSSGAGETLSGGNGCGDAHRLLATSGSLSKADSRRGGLRPGENVSEGDVVSCTPVDSTEAAESELLGRSVRLGLRTWSSGRRPARGRVRSGSKIRGRMSCTKPIRVPKTPPSLFSPIVKKPAVGFSESTCCRLSPSQTVTQSRVRACRAIPTRNSRSFSNDLPITTAISSRYASSSMSNTLRLRKAGSTEKLGCSTRSRSPGLICNGMCRLL